MRIVIDGSCWSNRRGFGRFTRCLVSALVAQPGHEYVLVVDEASRPGVDLPAHVAIDAVPLDQVPSEAASADGSRSVRDMARMGRAASRHRADVIFFPASYTYFPVWGAPVVVTLHDAIAERLPELVVPGRVARAKWQLKQRLALLQARHVLTVSEAARHEITATLKVRPHRISVVTEAPSDCFKPLGAEAWGRVAGLGIRTGDRYLLYVGGISPHKNLAVLVQAFALVAPRHPDVRLLLVGDDQDPFLSAQQTIRDLIRAEGLEDRVQLTGFVTDHQLVGLYSAAIAAVLPSLGEGFGLPAAESAACGTPMIASDLPALREVLGDGGTYVEPTDTVGFADAMESLIADPHLRDRRAAAALRQAGGRTWSDAARGVIEVLEGVVARA